MNKIKIGYKTYDIVYDDDKLIEEGLLGQIQYDKNLIRLRDILLQYQDRLLLGLWRLMVMKQQLLTQTDSGK